MLKKEKEYIDFYDSVMKKRINFLSHLKIKNTRNNEEFTFNQNSEYLIKNDYLFLVYNSIALQKKYENNDDYLAIFLTNSLNSTFHEFKQNKQKELVRNKNFRVGNTINLGYKILIDFFKSLYKDFKIDNKYVKLEYSKVIEAHASYCSHLHAIIFLKKEYLIFFQEYFLRKVKNNKNLGQYKFEIINDIQKSSAYILKYVQKDLSIENEKYKVFYGWKLKHKIRAYTFSRQLISRELFNKLSFHLSKKLIYDEDSFNEFNTTNFYELIHKFTQVQQEIIDKNTGEIKSKSKNFDEDDMFNVNLKKIREEIKDFNIHKINEIETTLYEFNIDVIKKTLFKSNLLNEFNFYLFNEISFNYQEVKDIVFIYHLFMFLNILKNKSRYKYQIKQFQIYKKHHSNSKFDLVFDKKDWIRTNSLQ
jgi:hypothetical protein